MSSKTEAEEEEKKLEVEVEGVEMMKVERM